jgi:hypothetical protein
MDVVLVIDDTGSMGGAIDNVKAGLAEIIDAAECASDGDLQMGLVTFKDEVEVDVTVTDDIDAVVSGVLAISATGGAGLPESSDEALRYIVTGMEDCATGIVGKTRDECLRILVLVTDAEPGGCDDSYADGVDDVRAAMVADAAADAGFLIAAVLVGEEGSYLITGAHPDGVEPDVMSNYAETTGGSYLVVPSSGEGTGDGIAGIIEACGGGACCLPDETCINTTPESCEAEGGEFQGEGVACKDVDCAGIEADLDIKPGSCPNSFNPRSRGVLPVGLLGSDALDATEVDISTLLISRADGVGGSVGPNEGPPGPHTVIADVGTPFHGDLCDCHEEEGDGVLDVSMKFKTQEVVEALELDDVPGGSLVELVVSGELLDGRSFTASDCVRIVPPGGGGTGELRVVPVSMSGTVEHDAWIGVSPLDMSLDGGGFGAFTRVFLEGSLVTVTAEATHDGRPFVEWRIDGHPATRDRTLVWIVLDRPQQLTAIYGSSQSRLSGPTQ